MRTSNLLGSFSGLAAKSGSARGDPLQTSSACNNKVAMSYYFIALTDKDAIGANHVPGGPFPGNDHYHSIDECDVLTSPHLWQLTAIAKNALYEDHTSELCPVWPAAAETDTQADGPVEQFIQRLPDTLRDELSQIVVTKAIATAWAECVWSMDPDHAERYIQDLVHLAAQAHQEKKHIYWWSST